MHLSSLGLCFRAGKMVCGTEIVINKLRQKKVYYIFLAKDSSNGTIKKVTDKAKFYNCPVNMDYTTDELSQAIGKSNRKVIGICDQGFVKIFRK